MVSQELLSELKMIILEDYGVEIKHPELSEIANTLVSFFGLLTKVNSMEDKSIKNTKELK